MLASQIFLAEQPSEHLLYTASYDPILVTLSVFVAVFASYAALLVSKQIRHASTGLSSYIWIAIGGLCMGLGIWSMHFVGMLAFNLPSSVSYDPVITAASVIPAIFASGLAIWFIGNNSRPTLRRLAGSGALIGAGIGAMHYTGMAAMHLDGYIRYDITLFLLSIVVAVFLAVLAMWIQFNGKAGSKGRHILLSTLTMGLAVSGMHYTAMTAAHFFRGNAQSAATSGLSPTFLAAIIVSVTSLIIVTTIVSVLVSRLKLESKDPFYGRLIIFVTLWGLISWFVAAEYYKTISSETYQRESLRASQHAEIAAMSLNESLKDLVMEPRSLARADLTLRALRRFNSETSNQIGSVDAKKRAWASDPTLKQVNERLAFHAIDDGPDLIWVVNEAGDCIAASNYDKPETLIGSNYADRQYFTKAQTGVPGNQFAVGRPSGIPGVFFSFPVMEGGKFLGAVVVKRNIAQFSQWIETTDSFLVDANGVVVMAADSSLVSRAIPAANALRLSPNALRQQYKVENITPLEMSPWRQDQYPNTWRLHKSQYPVALIRANLTDNVLTLYISHRLDMLERYIAEQYWLFLLLFTAGSMLIVAVSAVLLQLRESRRDEAELKLSRDGLNSAQRIAHIGSFEWNIVSGELKWSDEHFRLWGYVPGSRAPDYALFRHGLHPDDVSRVETDLQEALRGNGRYDSFHRVIRPDGSVHHIHGRGQVEFDDSGKPARMVGTVQDITERKKADESLRATSRLLDSIVENVPSMIFVKDAAELRFVLFNRTGELLLGQKREAMIGRNDYDFFPKEEADFFTAKDRETLQQAGMNDIPEEEIQTPAGTRLLHTKKIALRDETGQPQYLLGIAEDITDRKAAETAIIAARDEAERANRAKGEFLANMSHEIRTPMNAVLGMAHLLGDTTLNAKQREYLRSIEGASNILLRVINDILDFSKIEAGKLSLEDVPFDLSETLRNLSKVATTAVNGKPIDVMFRISPDVPRDLIGDPLRLGQVLVNLTNNAIKFTNHGEVIIGVSRVSGTNDTVTLKFEIIDTGIGMTSEQVGNLFKPFTQGDSSTTRRFGGTGLGLSICRRLVGLMGSELSVASEYGRGSKFHFTLSLRRQSSQERPWVEATDQLRNIKALVAEGNATAAMATYEAAHMLGWDVLAVDSLSKAQGRLSASNRDKPFDLLLLGEGDGAWNMESLRVWLQSVPVEQRPHVVLMARQGEDGPMQAQYTKDIDATLTKPFTPSDLFDTVASLVAPDANTQVRESSLKKTFAVHYPGAHVLVAEDNEFNQKLIVALLRKFEITTALARDGAECIKLLEQNPTGFDLVLMDVQMPVMDGLEATRQIRGTLNLSEIPVIALTANAMASDQQTCIDAGMSDFLAKPINVDEFANKLSQWLPKERAKPENYIN